MKKFILFLILFLGIFNAYAQDLSQKQILQQKITHRDSLLSEVSKKGLSDSLKMQIADYHQLCLILESENKQYMSENQDLRKESQNLREELRKIRLLASSDTLIFHQDFKSMDDIPIYLRERVEIIDSIINLRNSLVKTENTARELERSLGNSKVVYAAIGERINNDVAMIRSLIRKIKEMKLTLLSDEQQKYFRPGLTERFNNFSKYFE